MNGLNKVMLIGTVGADPETKILSESARVSTFRIATNETYTEKSTGTKKENTEWHNIEAWNNLSDTVSGYFKKGTNVFIEGKIKTDNYEDKDGKKVYRTKIVMESFVFTGNKKSDDQPGQYQQPTQQPQYVQQPVQQPVQQQPQYVQQPVQQQPQYVQQPVQQQPQYVQQPVQQQGAPVYMTDAQFIKDMSAPDDLPF